MWSVISILVINGPLETSYTSPFSVLYKRTTGKHTLVFESVDGFPFVVVFASSEGHLFVIAARRYTFEPPVTFSPGNPSGLRTWLLHGAQGLCVVSSDTDSVCRRQRERRSCLIYLFDFSIFFWCGVWFAVHSWVGVFFGFFWWPSPPKMSQFFVGWWIPTDDFGSLPT